MPIDLCLDSFGSMTLAGYMIELSAVVALVMREAMVVLVSFIISTLFWLILDTSLKPSLFSLTKLGTVFTSTSLTRDGARILAVFGLLT